MKEKDPKGTPKILMPLEAYKNLMEAKTLKATLKETKQHTCGTEPHGLPNLIRKKNDEIPNKQLKQA
jgi:hypothetical protein